MNNTNNQVTPSMEGSNERRPAAPTGSGPHLRESGQAVMAMNRLASGGRGRSSNGRSGTIAGNDIASDMRRLQQVGQSGILNASNAGPRRTINYHFDKFAVSDAIGFLMSHSLGKILLFFFISFVGVIGIFGLLLSITPDGIVTPHGGDANKLECCWLSLQTFTTIGYGSLSPKKRWAHFVVSADAFVGQLYVAVLTTVFLAHLMTPHAHWKVSDVVCVYQNTNGQFVLEARFLIAPGKVYYDVETFMQVEMNDSVTDPDQEVSSGTIVMDLHVEHEFALIRTGISSIKHIIDERSPLKYLVDNGITSLENLSTICVKVSCKDPRLQSMASSAKQFDPDAIVMNEHFAEMAMQQTDGTVALDSDLLSETRAANGVVRQRCVCGNIFKVDSKFCRKCGRPRPVERAEVSTVVEDEEEEDDGDEEAQTARWTLKWAPSSVEVTNPHLAAQHKKTKSKEAKKKGKRSSV